MKMFRIDGPDGLIAYRARKRACLAEAREISRKVPGVFTVHRLTLHSASVMIAVENALNGIAIKTEVEPVLLLSVEKGFATVESDDGENEEEA